MIKAGVAGNQPQCRPNRKQTWEYRRCTAVWVGISKLLVLQDCRLYFLFAFSFLLFTFISTAQVKIREKIEIAPKTISPISLDVATDGEPTQMIMNGDGYITLSVIGLDSQSPMQVILYRPYFVKVNGSLGASWDIPSIFIGTEIEVYVSFLFYDEYCWPSPGYCWHMSDQHIIERISDSIYVVYFDDITPGYRDDDFNDVIIQVNTHIALDHFYVNTSPDTIMSNNFSSLYILAVDQNGNECLLDDTTSITLTAEPNVGYFYPDVVAAYGDVKGDIAAFYPDFEPDSIQNVIITVSGSGTSGTDTLVVKKPPCLIMSVSKSEINPGERATISMMQKTWDGIVLPYPEDQVFNLWMNTDEQYGRLHCTMTEEEGTWISGLQPFEFIAADNIDVDSTVAEIEAFAWTGGGVFGSIDIGTKDKPCLSKSIIANQQTKGKNVGAVPKEMRRKGLEFKIDRLQTQLNNERLNRSNEIQQQTLTKRIEKLKARLSYETAKDPNEKQKSKTSMIQSIMLATEEPECKPVAWITIKKKSCEDAPQCPPIEQFSYPLIVVKAQPNGFENIMVCNGINDLGGFQELLNSYKPFDISPCFDQAMDKWRYNIFEPIEINVVMDVCRDIITNQRNQNLITSIDQIAQGDSSLALQDFKDHYSYPCGPIRQGGYMLEEVLWAHENVHKLDYEMYISSNRNIFDDVFKTARFTCEQIQSEAIAKEWGIKSFKDALEFLIKTVHSQWVGMYGEEYEKETHSNYLVRLLIKDYIEELKKKYNMK
jgi:hypothetical protein